MAHGPSRSPREPRGRSGGRARRAAGDKAGLRRAGAGRHAVPGAGDQPAGRPAAAEAGRGPVRHCRHHPGQAGGAGERDGAQRAAHGAGGLGRARRPAAGLLHRRGGLGGAEPAAQQPLLRLPGGAPEPAARADCHPLLPTGALADRQEQNSHDFPVIPRAAGWSEAMMKTTQR